MAKTKRIVVLGMLGARKDDPDLLTAPEAWRPTVALCRQPGLPVARLELLHDPECTTLAGRVRDDTRTVSPGTVVRLTQLPLKDPWDFEQAYGALHDFAACYAFDPEQEDYLVHLNVGTHVVRICMFLLTESRRFPGRLIQSIPPARSGDQPWGGYRIIDLDLTRYARIAERFARERHNSVSFLKYGIETCNAEFNRLIEEVEQVALATREPILLTGPTGAGKSRLARQIYQLKRHRRFVTGQFVEVNCATLCGDAAMSALFGHVKGAFTGAHTERAGLLRTADQGVLFLDEVTELGADEQAMLLRAIEQKNFLPVGSDKETSSDFQLIAGTNRDIRAEARAGRFRPDLLSRIDLWSFRLPGLKERPEDIEPNLVYELERVPEALGHAVTFSRGARQAFLDFARSPQAAWTGSFRDLNGAVLRMSTLASRGRIDRAIVNVEIDRLMQRWNAAASSVEQVSLVEQLIPEERARELDRFERCQLEEVLRVCQGARTLSEAGRTLFSASRQRKQSTNDAHRLRTYLERFGINWHRIVGQDVRPDFGP